MWCLWGFEDKLCLAGHDLHFSAKYALKVKDEFPNLSLIFSSLASVFSVSLCLFDSHCLSKTRFYWLKLFWKPRWSYFYFETQLKAEHDGKHCVGSILPLKKHFLIEVAISGQFAPFMSSKVDKGISWKIIVSYFATCTNIGPWTWFSVPGHLQGTKLLFYSSVQFRHDSNERLWAL